jgi:SNW domain-containing protein 1
MSALFPAPVRAYTTFEDEAPAASSAPDAAALPSGPSREIPRYPLRVRQRFIPRSLEDFGDGGAYPELHLAQFPLGMGKKGGSGSGRQSNALALQVRGEDGKVSYDAVVTQHHRNKTKVYTKFSDIVEKDGEAADALALPSRDDEAEATNRTKEALQALVQGQITSALPTNVARQKSAKEASSYVRYTPHDQGKMGGQSQQRIIRMVEVAKDPMEPPKFQHKKAVRGPPSPPVPVLHSPPRKLTVQDQQAWKIPPVISNWKNSKGFTIALDKRLAADGRGLQQVTVNDNFASLSEALAIAERKAREEVNMRAQVQKKLAMKQKEQKEDELRELASKARMERAGIRPDDDHEDDEDRGRGRRRSFDSDDERSDRGRRSGDEYDSDDERARRERDRIRRERKKEREREMRMEKLGKKGKLARDEDRDISEKIALGQLQGAGKLAGEAMFDSRLFNQSQGISSGFGHEDEYNVYSKPLVDRGKASVYRPKGDEGAFADADKDYEDLKGGQAKRFKADKQFRGTEEVARQNTRDGPVQFSYDNVKDEDEEKEKRGDRRARSPSRSRSRGNDRRRSPSRSLSRLRDRRRSPPRSPSRSPPRDRDRSPPRDRDRSPPRDRDRSPPRGGRDRSAGRRGRSRSRSRSRSLSRARGRRRSPSRSPVASRGRPRRRSPSYSRSRSRSRGREPERKRSRRDASDDDSDDPFGLDQFLTDARKGGDDSNRRRR